MRNIITGPLSASLVLLLVLLPQPADADDTVVTTHGPAPAVDVLVYGASSAGVGAAVAAARQGRDVLLVEPTGRVGGMMTNGVTSDIGRQNAATGIFDEYRALVLQFYEAAGIPGPYTRYGLFSEPEVSLRAVQQLLRAEPRIDVRTGWWLAEVPDAVKRQGNRVTGVTITDGGVRQHVKAGVVIDASAEGDVLGAAGQEGADWVVGREGRGVYLEENAPFRSDRLQQAYTYRMTWQVGGRTDYEVPVTYEEDRARFALVQRDPESRWTCRFYDELDPDDPGSTYYGLRIQRCLPYGKMDINIDLLGYNHEYPTASRAQRAVIEKRLRDFVIGWLHYVRTELDHPELGLSRDDYPETDGFPEVLYVREGRRAIGETVFTEHDAIRRAEPPSFQPSSVAIGDYGLDSHCVGPRGGVSGGPACSGGFWVPTSPYQVPYGVIVPARLDGLLVPMPVSASHVGYSTLRMEPVRIALGTAAGTAAAMAIEDGTPVRDVDVEELQRRLLVDSRQALLYLPSLDHTADDFAPRQFAALRLLERFDDVNPENAHLTSIWGLVRDGIMLGSGGSFDPQARLTRGQLASLLARAMDLRPVTPSRFSDVRGTVHEGNIEALTRRGIVGGYGDGTFRPHEPIRRDHTASMIARWLDLTPLAYGPFVDVPHGTTHAGAVNALHRHGVINGVASDRFNPAGLVSRDQAASFIHRSRGPEADIVGAASR